MKIIRFEFVTSKLSAKLIRRPIDKPTKIPIDVQYLVFLVDSKSHKKSQQSYQKIVQIHIVQIFY